MKKSYLLFSICLLLLSCSDNMECHLKMKKDCYDAFENYIKTHKEYPAYLLISKHFVTERGEVETAGYILGPCYSRFLEYEDLPILIEIDGKKIFFQTDMQLLIEPCTLSKESLGVASDEFDYDNKKPIWVNFIRHAIYIYFHKSELLMNSRPDTLFLPKIEKDDFYKE